MSNALYDLGREKFLTGLIDWSTDDIKIALIDGDQYTADLAVDEFLDDIPGGAITATSGNLTSKTTTGGVADADDVTFPNVSGPQSEIVVVYKDSGSSATSPLIAYFNIGTGLPVTPSGGNITVTWSNSASKIYPTTIGSSEDIGTPSVGLGISLDSIESSESLGNLNIGPGVEVGDISDNIVQDISIANGIVVGDITPEPIDDISISSDVVVGDIFDGVVPDPTISIDIAIGGITSSESLGNLNLGQAIIIGSIASSELIEDIEISVNGVITSINDGSISDVSISLDIAIDSVTTGESLDTISISASVAPDSIDGSSTLSDVSLSLDISIGSLDDGTVGGVKVIAPPPFYLIKNISNQILGILLDDYTAYLEPDNIMISSGVNIGQLFNLRIGGFVTYKLILHQKMELDSIEPCEVSYPRVIDNYNQVIDVETIEGEIGELYVNTTLVEFNSIDDGVVGTINVVAYQFTIRHGIKLNAIEPPRIDRVSIVDNFNSNIDIDSIDYGQVGELYVNTKILEPDPIDDDGDFGNVVVLVATSVIAIKNVSRQLITINYGPSNQQYVTEFAQGESGVMYIKPGLSAIIESDRVNSSIIYVLRQARKITTRYQYV